MNITSLKDFEALLYRAWEAKQVFLAQIEGAKRIQDFSCIFDPLIQNSGLLNTLRYYQEIQEQGFFPCIIDRNFAEYSEEEWLEAIEWLERQERPLVAVFFGNIYTYSQIRNSVTYYIHQPISPISSSPNNTLSAQSPSLKDKLRHNLLEAFQKDFGKSMSTNTDVFIEDLLSHITEYYSVHGCTEETALVLERVFHGLEGTLSDQITLHRQIKWSLFEYLASLKGRL